MGDTLIFTVGNLGSKLITIIMVPLYTYTLNTTEYGTVDLITNTISLFLPIATLAIGEALLRFIMLKYKSISDEQIMSNSFFFVTSTSLLIVILSGLVLFFSKIPFTIVLFFSLLLIGQLYQNIFSQFIRAINKLKSFAINGILTTFITATLNIIFLVYMKLGIDGFLLATLIGIFFSNIYLFWVGKIWKFIKIGSVSSKNLKIMIGYSLPLVPNTIMWWLIQGANRYILLFFIGMGENGLFAVASKIPSIVSMITSMFQQAWQLTAFEERENNSEESFYSDVFKIYYKFLFVVASFLLFIIKPLFKIAVNQQFYGSWKMVPFLLLGVIYQTLSSFYGTIYASKLRTKGVFTSSVLGAVASIIIGLLLVPPFGAIGSGISIACSFFIMWIVRVWDTRKMIFIRFDKMNFFLNNLIFLLQISFLFLMESNVMNFFFQMLLFFFIIFIDRLIFMKIFGVLSKKNI